MPLGAIWSDGRSVLPGGKGIVTVVEETAGLGVPGPDAVAKVMKGLLMPIER